MPPLWAIGLLAIVDWLLAIPLPSGSSLAGVHIQTLINPCCL